MLNNLDKICEYSLFFHRFPVFIKVADKARKTGLPRYIKINGQNLYNGKLNTFTKEKIHKELDIYVNPIIEFEKKIQQEECNDNSYFNLEYPYIVNIEYGLPKNYAGIKMIKSKLNIPKSKIIKQYFDLNNVNAFWEKYLVDKLTEFKILKDDNFNFIRGSIVNLNFVESYEDRYIKLRLIDYSKIFKL